jgi:5-methylcytosine-specific restriction protein A
MIRPELTKDAVLAAIAEFDKLGRKAFLAKYGYGKATKFELIHRGKQYDSKAIVGVAYRYPKRGGGQPFDHDQLSGGVADAVQKLRKLGFHVADPSEDDPDWTWDEHVLALDFYMAHPVSVPGKKSKEILQLSALLNELGRREGVIKTAKYRNANGVYMKLMNFRRLDPAFAAQGKVGLKRGAAGEKDVWARYANDRDGLAAAAGAIRLAIADPTVQLSVTGDQDDYEADESRVILKLHRSRERDGKLTAKKKSQAMATHGNLRCEVCSFDFSVRYGDHGADFIEAHHKRPVSTLKVGEKTKLSDLALVCANCHRMLHRGGDLLAITDLQAMLRT